jgi:tRNA(fMet)-specific endonuclease VapC
MQYMLDTNICVAFIRGKWDLLFHRVKNHELGDVCISSITLAELACGAEKSAHPHRNCRELLRFSAPLRVLAWGGNAAHAYGQIRATLEREGRVIGALDMLIAAHALAEDATIVTDNVREFDRVPGLSVENWITRPEL